MSTIGSAPSADAGVRAAPASARPAVATNSRRDITEGLSASVMAGYSAPAMVKLVSPIFATRCLADRLSVAIRGDQHSPVNRPWPPGLQKVSSDSPALSPEEALKTFYMPPGYHVELVASEPLIQEPVALDWDLEGRLWVVEMPGFMADHPWLERARSNRTRRRPRGHERRRSHGQANRICR